MVSIQKQVNLIGRFGKLFYFNFSHNLITQFRLCGARCGVEDIVFLPGEGGRCATSHLVGRVAGDAGVGLFVFVLVAGRT